jgi:hypothetical protein
LQFGNEPTVQYSHRTGHVVFARLSYAQKAGPLDRAVQKKILGAFFLLGEFIWVS